LVPEYGVVEAVGRVARVEKSEKEETAFFVGITFLQIKEEDREKILDFTYKSKKIMEKLEEIREK
jgi:c-di-GMP-binding flagellar brake protein YcgR